VQYWNCEDERCWRDISGDGERFQCVGCLHWFCTDCSQSFTSDDVRVCGSISVACAVSIT
jgi:hypothetical protein